MFTRLFEKVCECMTSYKVFFKFVFWLKVSNQTSHSLSQRCCVYGFGIRCGHNVFKGTKMCV